MSEATYRNCDDAIQIASPGTVACGEVLRTADGRAGIVQGLNPEGSGGTVSLAVEGQYDVACEAATTFDAGQMVYWDASANYAVTAPANSDDFYVGTALAAVNNATTVVRVSLNTAPSVGVLGTIETPWIAVDWADAAHIEVIPAAMNPTGFAVMGFIGKLTEQSAGASEDQLIVGLFEEDAGTAKSTITAANASADAIGDIVNGTLSVWKAADGAALAVVAADKAVEFGVSQATSGSGAAGTFLCKAFLTRL